MRGLDPRIHAEQRQWMALWQDSDNRDAPHQHGLPGEVLGEPRQRRSCNQVLSNT
jgi:hypothetical protein